MSIEKIKNERKLQAYKNPNGTFTKEVQERIVLLSDILEEPILNNQGNSRVERIILL